MISIKRFFFTSFLVIFFIVQPAFGQVKIGFYTGFGLSSFEWEGATSAETLPVGLQVYYSLESIEFVSLNFGLDFNYSAIPFSYTVSNAADQELLTREQNQLHIGALFKLKFAKEFILNPYIRLGAGLYSGGHSLIFVDALVQQAQQQQIPLPAELEISDNIGFNFGGGLDLKLTSSGNLGLFLEFVYHLNNRELDESQLNILQGVNLQKRDFGFDNLAILLGFQVGF